MADYRTDTPFDYSIMEEVGIPDAGTSASVRRPVHQESDPSKKGHGASELQVGAPRIDVIKILEQKHCMTILLTLLENGSCSKTKIYGIASWNPNMPAKLGSLRDAGLVEMFATSRVTMISLTPEGERVAGLIREIVGTGRQ